MPPRFFWRSVTAYANDLMHGCSRAGEFCFAWDGIPDYDVGVEVRVVFYSYFKDLTGCAQTVESIVPGEQVSGLLERLFDRFPKLASMRRSMLVAVGVEYQDGDYILKDGDEVSLFPPVQGG